MFSASENAAPGSDECKKQATSIGTKQISPKEGEVSRKMLGNVFCRMFFVGLITLHLVLVVPFSASAQTPADGKTDSNSSSRSEGDAGKKAAEQAGEDFIIGPGDVLNIFVWKESELSKSVPVRPDGKISLPLVNDVQAGGLTTLQLKESLTEKFRQFIAEPSVTVTVEAVNSQKVIISGEVTGGGPKPLMGPTRLMDILAVAGFTPFAKKSKIYVLRNEGGKQQRFPFNYKEYLKGKNQEQNILLKNGDMIVVP
jgi:polysaccharide biosynthesis/export protein